MVPKYRFLNFEAISIQYHFKQIVLPVSQMHYIHACHTDMLYKQIFLHHFYTALPNPWSILLLSSGYFRSLNTFTENGGFLVRITEINCKITEPLPNMFFLWPHASKAHFEQFFKLWKYILHIIHDRFVWKMFAMSDFWILIVIFNLFGFPEVVAQRCLVKQMLLKVCVIHRKTPVLESVLIKLQAFES